MSRSFRAVRGLGRPLSTRSAGVRCPSMPSITDPAGYWDRYGRGSEATPEDALKNAFGWCEYKSHGPATRCSETPSPRSSSAPAPATSPPTANAGTSPTTSPRRCRRATGVSRAGRESGGPLPRSARAAGALCRPRWSGNAHQQRPKPARHTQGPHESRTGHAVHRSDSRFGSRGRRRARRGAARR